jgi:hypothetical protein
MDKDATINARLPSELRTEVNRQAIRLGWKPARVVREALLHYLPILALIPKQKMTDYHAYIIRCYEDRFQLIGFSTYDDLLRSLPCRQSTFDAFGNTPRLWPNGTLLSDCSTRESACVSLSKEAVRIRKMPWPDTLPDNCEVWIR